MGSSSLVIRLPRQSHREAGHPDFGILMIRVNSCAFMVDFLQNQHAIAVAIKAVPFANRFFVSAQQEMAACKCAH